MNSLINLFHRIYQNKKLILVFLFLISILISLVFLIFFKNVGPAEHAEPGSDYIWHYALVAESIMQGDGAIVLGEVDTDYPPGYPLILSVLFSLSNLFGVERMLVIIIFNTLITALSVCFLFFLIKSILNKKIAFIATILWASYPFNLWLIKNPNTEVPFILIFYCALWVYVLGIKKRSLKMFLISGALIGVASLIRPIVFFLPVALIVSLFVFLRDISFNKKILFSLTLVMACIIVISPWIIYVYVNKGDIILLSTTGSQAIAAGFTMMTENLNKESIIILSDDMVTLINNFKTANSDSFIGIISFFFDKLITQPVALLKIMTMKAVRAWYATSSMWREKETLIIQLFYLIPGIMGIWIWLKRKKEKLSYLLFLLLIISYFWLATTTALSILRYMIPVMGIIMIFLSITFWHGVDKLKKNRKNEA